MNPVIKKFQKPALTFWAVLWLASSVVSMDKAIRGGGVGWWLWCGVTAFFAFITIVGVLRMGKPES